MVEKNQPINWMCVGFAVSSTCGTLLGVGLVSALAFNRLPLSSSWTAIPSTPQPFFTAKPFWMGLVAGTGAALAGLVPGLTFALCVKDKEETSDSAKMGPHDQFFRALSGLGMGVVLSGVLSAGFLMRCYVDTDRLGLNPSVAIWAGGAVFGYVPPVVAGLAAIVLYNHLYLET